jgi:hypothetical protein
VNALASQCALSLAHPFSGGERKVIKQEIIWPLVLVMTSALAPTAASSQQAAAPLQSVDSLRLQRPTQQARRDSARAPSVQSPAQAPQQARGAYMNVSFVGLTDFGWSTEPDVGSLQVGDHDPKVRGFSIPNAELVLDGAVDPYFRGFANIVYKLDAEGETGVELEEMYFLTAALPGNLQLKGGQFFAEFGRQNPQHPHAWGFADQPLVLNRMFGGEGLRSQGVRLSWLLPTSWYTEAMVSVMNSTGETTSSFRSEESTEIHGGEATERAVERLGDLLFVPRLSTSIDLTSTQTVLLGGSAAFGPNNAGPDANTQVYGLDLYWKWKSPTAGQGFPFVSFQTEVLERRYHAPERDAIVGVAILPAITLRDRGAYAQLLWGIKPLIVAGLRGEFVDAQPAGFNSDLRADRYRISPDLTWYPTEFSKFRVQYNYDHRSGIGVDHSLWFQLEFLLGAHAAHKF